MKIMQKAGRVSLAVLLAALTCMSPATLVAFAEDGEPSQTATNTTLTAASVNLGTESTEASDAHTFNIGTFLQLADAYKYDINNQSGQTFVINLTDDITLERPPAGTIDSQGKRFFVGTDRLCVKNGNTVTILGHGHSIIYNDNTINNLTLGTRDGNLILGAADGSDTLNLNFVGSNTDLGALVNAVGGSLAIHNGVTLSNNANATAYSGGGISAAGGAVVNMDGGLIENNSNTRITWGGGVSVDGATFNMTGGTIKGNSEVTYGDYLGYGGGVALSDHGDESTFHMSGDAVIEGNSAPFGGGVYVGPNGTFTMDGNASIVNNKADNYGGGVYVAQKGTFTMGENNVISGNSAAHGGGVINFGTATVTNVYDNDATRSGADLYNAGTITMEPVKAEWTLSKPQATSDLNGDGPSSDVPSDKDPHLSDIHFMSLAAVPLSAAMAVTPLSDTGTAAIAPSNTSIDDWYYDGHRETGETDENGNAVVDHSRWNANEDTADTPQYLVRYVPDGTPTTEVMGLKAAHGVSSDEPEMPKTVNVIWEDSDGTQLFKLTKVDAQHIPAADEYEPLSGNEEPEKAADDKDTYEFVGWDRTDEPNGDVIYMAEYNETPINDPQNPTTPEDPTTPTTPTTPVESTTPSKTTPSKSEESKPSSDTKSESPTAMTIPQLGDETGWIFAIGGLVLGASVAGLGIARRKMRS